MIASPPKNQSETESRLWQYKWARWYDSQAGRWISEDPLGFAAGDANLARYVGNGAINTQDPSGLKEPLNPPSFTPKFGWMDKILNNVVGATPEYPSGLEPGANWGPFLGTKYQDGPTFIAEPGMIPVSPPIMVFVTIHSAPGDYEAIIKDLKKMGVKNPKDWVFTGISNWGDIKWHLAKMPNGSLNAIVLSGHDNGSGVSTKKGVDAEGESPLTIKELTAKFPEVKDLINAKLKPTPTDPKKIGGVVVMGGCTCGSFQEQLMKDAVALGNGIIASIGFMEPGLHSDTDVKGFFTEDGKPGPYVYASPLPYPGVDK